MSAGEPPRVEETPQIDCPLCGSAVRQVSSATLSLALWQHVNLACPNAADITALRQQVKELQEENSRDIIELVRQGQRATAALEAEVKTRDEQIARLEAAGDTEQRAAFEAGVVTEYWIGGDPRNGPEITLKAYRQRDGGWLWSVRRLSDVLNRDGDWEYEPIPSSRDDAYRARVRFATPAEAYTRYQQSRTGEKP